MNRKLEYALLAALVIATAITLAASLPHPKIPCQLTTMPTGQFHCAGSP